MRRSLATVGVDPGDHVATPDSPVASAAGTRHDGRVTSASEILLRGARVEVLIGGSENAGALTVLRYTAPPRFAGPPRHRHAVTTEAFYVLEGQLSVDLEESTLLLGPGEHAGVPVDTVHAFRNDSDSPTTFLVVAVPAGLEEFLGELATLIDQTPDWPPQDTSAIDELNLRFDQLRPRT
jgi:quercetin dioxygenase-like cupin family protein